MDQRQECLRTALPCRLSVVLLSVSGCKSRFLQTAAAGRKCPMTTGHRHALPRPSAFGCSLQQAAGRKGRSEIGRTSALESRGGKKEADRGTRLPATNGK